MHNLIGLRKSKFDFLDFPDFYAKTRCIISEDEYTFCRYRQANFDALGFVMSSGWGIQEFTPTFGPLLGNLSEIVG